MVLQPFWRYLRRSKCFIMIKNNVFGLWIIFHSILVFSGADFSDSGHDPRRARLCLLVILLQNALVCWADTVQNKVLILQGDDETEDVFQIFCQNNIEQSKIETVFAFKRNRFARWINSKPGNCEIFETKKTLF